MALLEIALAYVLINEGGVSDQANDRGGLTNAGITQGTLSTYLGRPATRQDVLGLTDTVKAAVYRKLYWTPIKGDQITSQAVATVLMDMAVLMGPSQAAKLAQRIAGVKDDGVVGPVTLLALNKLAPAKFVDRFSTACCLFFSSIAVRDQTQVGFLGGWTVRSHKMQSVLLA